jgi:anti-sigma B factor antagonist
VSEVFRDVHSDAVDLLWIDRTVDNLSVVLRAVGEVDHVSAPVLDEQLRIAEAIVVPPAPVVLDLEGVSFFGSVGLTVLLRHHDRCVELGTRLEVTGSHAVRRTVTVTGLDHLLSVRRPSSSSQPSAGLA